MTNAAATSGQASRAIDVRERGGAWGPLQSAKNHLLYALARAVLAACARAPARALRAAGRGVGRAAHALLGGARRTALANVARAMPELSEHERRAFVRRVFAELGAHLGDAVATLRPNAPVPLLDFPDADRDVLERARAEGRGVLFASAHLGPWERVAATLVARGVPLTVLAREAYDPRLTALYEKLRAPRGVRAIYRGHAGAPTRIVRVLRSGGVLGVPIDLRSRVPSVDAPFLGHPAPTPVGPARIALRTGAAVVVGACAPGDAIAVTRITTANLRPGEDGERELTTRINHALSERIRAMPSAWVWMHPRY